MPVPALLVALSARLRPLLGETPTLEPLTDTGLAHWHVHLNGTGLLARIPKQSQMGLTAADNLAYEAACFNRATPSGHVPLLHLSVTPNDALPWGALLVQEIAGTPANSITHLPAIMRALAAIHRLSVPAPALRPPLLCETPALSNMLQQINTQAAYLDQPQVAPASRQTIQRTLSALSHSVTDLCRDLPPRLIAFDAHPGNFLITAQGQAVLVDLEKMRYGLPPLDLAHATLYTSTTWDVSASFELSVVQIAAAYQTWIDAMGHEAAPYLRALVPLRTLMWLWSVTWCAKWLGESSRPRHQDGVGEDWSQDNSESTLVAHVHNRVTHYLEPATIARVLAELEALRPCWC